MSKARKIIYYFTIGIGVFLIIITALSLFDTEQWYLEILKFPRLTILITLGIIGGLSFLLSPKRKAIYFIFIGCLIAAMVVQGSILSPYTQLIEEKVASADDVAEGESFSIFVVNVLMKNRKADELLKMINERSPDILLTMEVDEWWVSKLKGIEQQYPHHISFPVDNAYGMSLYSKLPLSDNQTLFLDEKDVPSFYCTATMNDGTQFKLVTLHPVPPMPSRKYPDNVGEKGEDKALIKAARKIARYKRPTIVAGDFNDVSWSHNTLKFSDISGLNDVRHGRGLYNTFDAKSFFLKWPLDHIYVSEEFKLVTLERLSEFGSDHNPLYAELVYSP